MSVLRDMKRMSRDRIFLPRDKSVDLSFSMSRDIDLLLCRSIAETGDLLSKHAVHIL